MQFCPADAMGAQAKKAATPTIDLVAWQKKAGGQTAPKEAEYEFGGPPGAVGIMVGLPLVILVLFFGCGKDYCANDLASAAQLPQRSQRFCRAAVLDEPPRGARQPERAGQQQRGRQALQQHRNAPAAQLHQVLMSVRCRHDILQEVVHPEANHDAACDHVPIHQE